MIKIKNSFKNKGFALLYAVVVSSMLLAVALGVSNIAYKEIIFGTSAKDANEAFYAADTAAECTLYYDNGNNNMFTDGSLNGEKCNGKDISLFVVADGGYYDKIYTFTISELGNSGKACANITVEKDENGIGTRITSVGYNNGGGIAGICEPTATSVQRVLELNY